MRSGVPFLNMPQPVGLNPNVDLMPALCRFFVAPGFLPSFAVFVYWLWWALVGFGQRLSGGRTGSGRGCRRGRPGPRLAGAAAGVMAGVKAEGMEGPQLLMAGGQVQERRLAPPDPPKCLSPGPLGYAATGA